MVVLMRNAFLFPQIKKDVASVCAVFIKNLLTVKSQKV